MLRIIKTYCSSVGKEKKSLHKQNKRNEKI